MPSRSPERFRRPSRRLVYSAHVRDWHLEGRMLCIPVLGLQRSLSDVIAVEMTSSFCAAGAMEEDFQWSMVDLCLSGVNLLLCHDASELGG